MWWRKKHTEVFETKIFRRILLLLFKTHNCVGCSISFCRGTDGSSIHDILFKRNAKILDLMRCDIGMLASVAPAMGADRRRRRRRRRRRWRMDTDIRNTYPKPLLLNFPFRVRFDCWPNIHMWKNIQTPKCGINFVQYRCVQRACGLIRASYLHTRP